MEQTNRIKNFYVIDFNSIDQRFNNYKKTLKLTDLEQNLKYKVKELRKVKCKYGERLVIESEYFQCFLPARYSKIDSDNLKGLNEAPELYFEVQYDENKNYIRVELYTSK